MDTSSVLFYLIPVNTAARKVAQDPSNSDFRAYAQSDEDSIAVGQLVSSCLDHGTIVTLGRQGDIRTADDRLSRHHCSFVLNEESQMVMVVEKSLRQTTNLTGECGGGEFFSFERGRPRKVALNRAIETSIGLGDPGEQPVHFRIKWTDNAAAVLKRRTEALRQQTPRHSPTPDIVYSTVRPLKTRFWKLEPALGRGSFGEVHKAVNADSGQLIAVKAIKKPAASADNSAWKYLKREIQALGSLQHVSIVKLFFKMHFAVPFLTACKEHVVHFLGFQNWEQEEALIFMALMDGTLASLTCNSPGASCTGIAQTALAHMLQAIDFLAAKNFVHRDLKPDNILYRRFRETEYHFRLGDLGFCNSTDVATSNVGTPIYQAPEIDVGERQTPKVDVWSLYVTMLWTMDIHGFRVFSNNPGIGRLAVHNRVLSIAAHVPMVSSIKEMARSDPERRASAAQILVKCFEGAGLTTDQHDILPIPADGPATTFYTSWAPTSDNTGHGP